MQQDYPYVSEDGHKEECKNKKETRDVGVITGWEDVPANDEKALMKAAAHQPVSVAIEADTFPFQFYSVRLPPAAVPFLPLPHLPSAPKAVVVEAAASPGPLLGLTF